MRSQPKQWTGYAAALCASGLASFLATRAAPHIPPADVRIIFLLGVALVAARFGFGPSIVASLTSIAAFDFLILPPIFSFSFELGQAVTFSGLVLMSALISGLAESLRREQARALKSEQNTQKARLDAEVERVHAALLSSVSHDLRAPLATISASAQMLVHSHVEMDPTLRGEVLSGIADEAERLDGLLRNLLAITRLESGELRLKALPTSLDEVLSAALQRMESRLVGRELRLACERGLPLVELDARLFEQVLINVLDNALRYSPAGSPLEIRTARAAQVVEIHVCDSGRGVAKADRELVFEKFRRGSNAPQSDGGVGLGLTICRAILQAHRGKIELSESALGGARVTLSLPISTLQYDALEHLQESA